MNNSDFKDFFAFVLSCRLARLDKKKMTTPRPRRDPLRPASRGRPIILASRSRPNGLPLQNEGQDQQMAGWSCHPLSGLCSIQCLDIVQRGCQRMWHTQKRHTGLYGVSPAHRGDVCEESFIARRGCSI